ncbi:MAG: DUF234 domain-containing protein [Candidatus Cloacimonetes bacterium]|nr:DUF234 domain-containing protein [Candidatus Cloacimonadota bacterium]
MHKRYLPYIMKKCGKLWNRNNEIDVVGIGDDG